MDKENKILHSIAWLALILIVIIQLWINHTGGINLDLFEMIILLE